MLRLNDAIASLTQRARTSDQERLCVLGVQDLSEGETTIGELAGDYTEDGKSSRRAHLSIRMQSPKTGIKSALTWDMLGCAFANST